MWQIDALAKAHERGGFSCGNPDLDRFIRELAMQYERRNIGRTYVALVPPTLKVLGYYTLASGHVAFNDLPVEIAKKLPHHPIPVAHLGRLAVDQSARGQGLGGALLFDAFRRAVALSKSLGIFAMEVKAADENARQFYLKHDFLPLPVDELRLYLPLAHIAKLFR